MMYGVVIQMERALVDEFVELVSIDAESGDEARMASTVADKLRAIGLDVTVDGAGNVVGRTAAAAGCRCHGEPFILCAHLDRVKPGRGIRPVIADGIIRSSGDTILAADDIAGVTAILAGLRGAAARGGELPAVEVVFTVGEEVHLAGAQGLDYASLRSKEAYIFDASRPVGVVVTSSPTHVGIEAHVTGRAARVEGAVVDDTWWAAGAGSRVRRRPHSWKHLSSAAHP